MMLPESGKNPPQRENDNENDRKDRKLMNAEHETAPIKPTGRIYGSVDDLMKGEDVSPEVRAKVVELRGETRIILQLAKLRQKAGLKQEDIADRLGVNQSAISKLESGKDEDLSVRQVREYAKATGERIALVFGKQPTHVEAVKLHALGDLRGSFEIKITDLPESGIIKSLFFQTQLGDFGIKMKAEKLSIKGAPINEITWQVLDDAKTIVVVIEADRIKMIITEDYLTSALTRLESALKVFVLGKLPNEPK